MYFADFWADFFAIFLRIILFYCLKWVLKILLSFKQFLDNKWLQFCEYENFFSLRNMTKK